MTFSWSTMDSKVALIAERLRVLRDGDQEKAVLVNLACMAEECGEAVAEVRRLLGHARYGTTVDKVSEELADVVIATLVTAKLLGVDMETSVARKLGDIEKRGGV